jgi:hypothetical protein
LLAKQLEEKCYTFSNISSFNEENINDDDYLVIAYMPFETTSLINLFFAPFDFCIRAQISIKALIMPHSFSIKCGPGDEVDHYYQEFVMNIDQTGRAQNVKLLETIAVRKFYDLKDERLTDIRFYRPFDNDEYVFIWGCINLQQHPSSTDQAAWILKKIIQHESESEKYLNENFINVSDKITVSTPEFVHLENFFLINRITDNCFQDCAKISPSDVHNMLQKNSLTDRQKTFDIFYIDPHKYKFLAFVVLFLLINLAILNIRRILKYKCCNVINK